MIETKRVSIEFNRFGPGDLQHPSQLARLIQMAADVLHDLARSDPSAGGIDIAHAKRRTGAKEAGAGLEGAQVQHLMDAAQGTRTAGGVGRESHQHRILVVVDTAHAVQWPHRLLQPDGASLANFIDHLFAVAAADSVEIAEPNEQQHGAATAGFQMAESVVELAFQIATVAKAGDGVETVMLLQLPVQLR